MVQSEISQPKGFDLTTSAATTRSYSTTIHGNLPILVLLCSLNDLRQLVLACYSADFAFYLTQRLVVHGKVTPPAPRVHHDAPQQLHFKVKCPRSKRAPHGGTGFGAPFLLILLDEPQVDRFHARVGAEVRLDAAEDPALAGNCAGSVICGLLLEVEIRNLFERKFAEAGARAV